MTPELMQWALEVSQKALNRMDTAHAASPAAAEFWIREFMEEVELRVAEYGDPRGDALEDVFDGLKQKFLGIDTKS